MHRIPNMQRFLKWLGTRLFGEPEPAHGSRARVTNACIRSTTPRRSAAPKPTPDAPAPLPPGTREAEQVATLGARIEDGGPGKNILVADTESLSMAEADLQIVDSGEPAAPGDGFDPYNTGRFDRSANWSRIVRK